VLFPILYKLSYHAI